MCKQISLIGAALISRCVTHSYPASEDVAVPGLGAVAAEADRRHCSSFQPEKLYFHCQAMKCLCMTAARTTNQSYTSGVNRTETDAAVTQHRTLPVYGLIIHQRLH